MTSGPWGGSVLCLEAQDLENNFCKVKLMYFTFPRKFVTLLSLLKYKHNSPSMHNGNCLREASVAMGLLGYASNPNCSNC